MAKSLKRMGLMRESTETYKIVVGLRIQADIFRPADDDLRPVVVWIHGGALIGGQRTGIAPAQRDRYLDAGFAVVSIDYRLAPETKLAAIVEDIEDGLSWVREVGAPLYRFDRRKLAVVGHSAGGYLALTAGARCRPRPNAVVAFYGYGDIVGSWYSRPDPFYCRRPLVSEAEAYAFVGGPPIAGAAGLESERRFPFYLYCRQQGLWPQLVSGENPDEHPGVLDAWSPIQNVTQDYPPTMLLHGDADTDVPYEQSVIMAAELRRVGVPHEFITIPNGEHGFDRNVGGDDPVADAAFEGVLAFLGAYLIA